MIEAVKSLHRELSRYPWFASASQGCGKIMVWVHHLPPPHERAALPSTWLGYPVACEYLRAEARRA